MIKNLLKQVNLIKEKHEEIAKVKNENFNLFNIMRMRTDEVKTHSAIISELLNPKGSHNLGDTFLKLFIERILSTIENENYPLDFFIKELNSTKVFIEYNIGPISKDYTKGGRIDILISNKNFEICIENKINASDQPYQVTRYHNYLSSRKKKTLLLYLTLDGKDATTESICSSKMADNEWIRDEDSLLEVSSDYFPISYKTTILKWLEECYAFSIDRPILRESLKQYKLLIKSLTHQSTSEQMEKEIQKTILTDIESAEIIHNSFIGSLNSVIITFCEHLRIYLIDSGISEEAIEVRNWKNENRFFTVFINGSESKHRIGFEIYNGSANFSEAFSMIDIENDRWGKQPIEKWDKSETYKMLSDYHNSTKKEKESLVKRIYDIMIQYK